ncbi:MAG: FAD-binding oxidoreductase [Coriobacteriia bacterium]|nr:FAD-binding oxidoreductase [Coriobacteriia bacterium]MBN2840316.1 FAD-binding oxidoreductase [Coriobacteriia bacterium]
MGAVSERVESQLRDIFGDRMRTDRVERKLYSSDIGAMPRLIKPLVPTGVAGAVVRPVSEDEVVALMRVARAERVPVVPRGMSTSGYGGVLPVEGAIVADMSAMGGLISVDAEALTVRVFGGTLWEPLQKQLNRKGLDLRLYPSSLPSSTVAGWFAQGGAGFGSYEHGFFKESVHAARVVHLDGTVKEYTGDELEHLVADAEGITGIITELEFAIRSLEDEVHRVLALPTIDALQKALSAISAQQLPIWSLTFLNPESIKLKKTLPHRHGHPYELAHEHYEPVLPEAFLAVIAYPASRHEAIDAPLRAILEAAGGTELEAEAAEHEWEQRFAPMRLKRVGPSIVPTEVVVPLGELDQVLSTIDARVKQPFILEGMLGKGDKVVLLGFIPHDERSLAFNVAFALSLVVIKIANQHRGGAYSTGLYFRQEGKKVLGEAKLAALQAFKRANDPANLLNPRKVVGSSLLNGFMKFALAIEPVVRPIANLATPPGKVESLETKNGVPGDVAFYSYACAQCGYCVPTCEEYSVRGWMSHSPRGKYAYLKEVVEGRETFDQKMVDTFLVCTTCEVCNTRCQLQLPVEHSWMAMRGQLIHEEGRMTFPPFEMMGAALQGELNIWAGKREKRADWMPEHIAEKIDPTSDILYFAGCTASYVNEDVAQSSVELLDAAGVKFNYMGTDEACCGIPMKVSGKWDVFEEIYEHNTSEARKRGAKTIVTSCPACGLVWKELYANIAAERGEEYEFEVKHYSELVAESIAEGALEFTHEVNKTLTFHDSCHMGRAQGNYEAPRELIKAIPGVKFVEMEHNCEDALCCGSVLTLIGETPVAPELGKMRLDEAVDVGADAMVALCPCCQVQFRDSIDKKDIPMEVLDLAHLAMDGLGIAHADPTPYAMEMWGHFEKFIWLMKPESITDIMVALLPDMMKAMPPAMLPMMRAARAVPGGLALMGKMMPSMMPRMMPAMMPKVMPAMLAEVSRRVGQLPEDMEELMPDLLPKTMDALLPNMLPLIMDDFLPKMLCYIKNEWERDVPAGSSPCAEASA